MKRALVNNFAFCLLSPTRNDIIHDNDIILFSIRNTLYTYTFFGLN